MAENRSGRSLDIVLQVSELNFRFFVEKIEIFEKSWKKLIFYMIFDVFGDFELFAFRAR